MKKKIAILCVLLITFTCGCSLSTDKRITVESDDKDQDMILAIDSNRHIDRKVSGPNELTFPVSDNPRLLGLAHDANMIGALGMCINDYRRVHDYYPESLTEYIESGFPLFWQRNLMNGLPMELLTSREVTADQADYGVVKYTKQGNDAARLMSSNIDLKNYKEKGDVNWLIEDQYFEFFYENDQDFLHEREDSYPEEGKADTGNTENLNTVIGGTIPINEVSDPEIRELYAMAGQLSNFIFTSTLKYYQQYNYLPDDFVDYLTFQHIVGTTPFIIRENFDAFSQKLQNADVEFKIGYDSLNITSYALLKINGETLISHCYRYDDYENVDLTRKDNSPGIHAACHMEEIDMSSPIITEANISSLNIPDEFFVSIEDIPVR